MRQRSPDVKKRCGKIAERCSGAEWKWKTRREAGSARKWPAHLGCPSLDRRSGPGVVRAKAGREFQHGGHHVDTIPKLRKAASRRPSRNALKSLRDFGAGEGIRTLDPNLGKVVSQKGTWCGRRDSNPHSQRETDFLTTSAFAAAIRRSWPGLSLRHGLSAEGAARPVSTPSLNRGFGSGLAWGSSPLAFPDFERFCSTNFPVGTPIGSLLRLPISPRPHCHIRAITRFVAR